MANILLIAEKPTIGKLFLDIIEKYKKDFPDNYYIDYVKPVFHFDDHFLLFRKKNNTYYQCGHKSDFKSLKLNSLDIPNDTFLEVNSSFSSKNFSNLPKIDKIISICDNDDCGKLAFTKYLEEHNLNNCNVEMILLYSLTENDILNALKNSHLTFKNVFDELKTKLITSNFSSQYCREKNIIYLRMETGMSRTDFAKYFNIPYRTLENWERKDNKCPTYLYDLIEYKIINEGLCFKD